MKSEEKSGLKKMTYFLLSVFISGEREIKIGKRHVFYTHDSEDKSCEGLNCMHWFKSLRILPILPVTKYYILPLFHIVNASSDNENDHFEVIKVRVPRRDLKLVHEMANFWCKNGSSQPMIVIPSERSSESKIIPLLNHPSILCSWDGPDSGLGVFFLPNFRHFFINEVAKSRGTEIILNFPTEKELFILAPTGVMYCLENDSVINPRSKIYPFQPLSLPMSPTTPVELTTIEGILNGIISCLSTPSDELAENLDDEQTKSDGDTSVCIKFIFYYLGLQLIS